MAKKHSQNESLTLEGNEITRMKKIRRDWNGVKPVSKKFRDKKKDQEKRNKKFESEEW